MAIGVLTKKVVWPQGPDNDADLLASNDTLVICPGDGVTLDFVGPNTHQPLWPDSSSAMSWTHAPEALGVLDGDVNGWHSGFGRLLYVEVLPLSVVQTNLEGFVPVCDGSGLVTLEASGEHLVEIAWLYNGELSDNTPSFLVSQLGTYVAVATDTLTGCGATSEPVVVDFVASDVQMACTNNGWELSVENVTQENAGQAIISWQDANGTSISDSATAVILGPGNVQRDMDRRAMRSKGNWTSQKTCGTWDATFPSTAVAWMLKRLISIPRHDGGRKLHVRCPWMFG